MSFENISPTLIEALKKENIVEPTQVQTLVISKILENKDLIVQSETGSGKTLAYLLPLFEKIQPVKREMQVLILVPTHELAIQINKQIERLSQNSEYKVNSIAIIGDVNIERQIEKLREKPQFIVGSAGRILKLIQMRKIAAHTIKTVVIDEADRMMDRNNVEGIKAIVKCTLRDRQLLLFSASMPHETISIARDLMKEPEIIKATVDTSIPASIEHIYFVGEQRDKIEILRKVIGIIKPNKSIIFVNQPQEIELITEKLRYHGLEANCIYGEYDKTDRKMVMDDFKSGKIKFLIASDIAARGIHFDDITCIFNMSIVEDPLNYLHRVGRTGRNGKVGLAVSIVTENEISIIRHCERNFNIKISAKDMYKGNIIDLKARY